MTEIIVLTFHLVVYLFLFLVFALAARLVVESEPATIFAKNRAAIKLAAILTTVICGFGGFIYHLGG